MSKLYEILKKHKIKIWILFVISMTLALFLGNIYVPEQSVKPLWKKYGDGIKDMTPDGTLLIDAGGPLHLYNSNGETLWETENIHSEDARISDNGEFIVSTLRDKEEGTFYGSVATFDKDGEKLWSYETGKIEALSMTSNGDLIVLTAFDKFSKSYYTFTYHIYLFDKEGNKLWDKVMDQHFESISISENGYIITGSREGMIFLFDKEGKIMWSKDTKLDVRAVAITEDGHYIFFSSKEITQGDFPWETNLVSHFNAYNINGERLWSQKIVGPVSSISISSNGEYIAVAGYFLFNIDGELLWTHYGSATTPKIAIDKRGRYVVADVGEYRFPFFIFHNIYVFDREGNILWKYRSGDTIISLDISDDGRYVTFAHRGLDMFFFDNLKAIEEYKKGLEGEERLGFSIELIVALIIGVFIFWKIIRRGTK